MLPSPFLVPGFSGSGGSVINKKIGLKVSESEENIGLDKTQHGETAYNI
jgi:ammonia channel protein AmtB